MKSFINNIYIFSKLSISLLVLVVLFSMAYIFYKSYAKQENSLNNKNKEEKIIIDLISKNSEKIENTMNETNIIITNLNDIIISEKKNNKEISDKLKTTLKDIKNEIKFLENNIKSIQKNLNLNQILFPELSDKNIKIKNYNEIIALIKIKFENGKNFSKEIDFLNQVSKKNIQPFIEKLYVLNNQKFKGNKLLLLEFENETNKYISKNFFNKNPLVKNLLPYINIQPSKNNDLYKKELINIKNINSLIVNKKYDESIKLLILIDSENKHFNITLEQLSIGKIFYFTLEKIIKND